MLTAITSQNSICLEQIILYHLCISVKWYSISIGNKSNHKYKEEAAYIAMKIGIG